MIGGGTVSIRRIEQDIAETRARMERTLTLLDRSLRALRSGDAVAALGLAALALPEIAGDSSALQQFLDRLEPVRDCGSDATPTPAARTPPA